MAEILGSPEAEPHKAVLDHLSEFAGGAIWMQEWNAPKDWAPLGYSIVTIEPTERCKSWTYATAGCWQAQKPCHWRSELLLAALDQRPEHERLLKMAALFQLDPTLGIEYGGVIDIGHPWVDGSSCTHLLASPPYEFAFGDMFWDLDVIPCTRFIWLLPITSAEAAFAKSEGSEKLEEEFQRLAIDFIDPFRAPVIT